MYLEGEDLILCVTSAWFNKWKRLINQFGVKQTNN